MDGQQVLSAQLLLGWLWIRWRHVLSAGPTFATTPTVRPAPSAVTADSSGRAAGVAPAVAALPSSIAATRTAALALASTASTASHPAITSGASFGPTQPTTTTDFASIGAAARKSASIAANCAAAIAATGASAT